MKELGKIIEIELKKLSLEERRLFREDSLKTFYELLEKTTQNMSSFENHILESIGQESDDVNIETILVPEDMMYLFEESYSSILKKETEESFLETIESEEKIYKRIFINDSYDKIQELDGKKLKGSINVKGEVYSVNFMLKHDIELIKRLEFLYDVFSLNSVKWKTYNSPYVRKAFVLKVIDFDESIYNSIDGTEEIVIEKEDLKEKWIEDHTLMWNIKETIINGDGLIRPTINRIHYEHTILLEDIKNVYLTPTEHHVYHILKPNNETLKIFTSEAGEILWRILRIGDKDYSKSNQLKYSFFTNKSDLSFVNKLKLDRNIRIRSEGELKRIIYSFSKIREYFKFCGVEISQSKEGVFPLYEVNSFIVDEFSLKGKLTYLKLSFEFLKIDIYTMDLLSFLISEIQLYFPEYKCVGVKHERT